MLTFIFIILCVIAINLYKWYSQGRFNDKKEASKNTQAFASYTLIVIILGVILINIDYDNNLSKPSNVKEMYQTDTILHEEVIVLTEQQKFLSLNGFKADAEFSDLQFNEFKKLMDSEIFKNRDFCTVYHTTMKLNGKELKKYVKTISEKPYLEDMIIMYGMKVCEPYSKEEMESKRKPSYQSSDIACEMSKDFIKQDLNYPKTADFSMFDCSVESNNDGSYTIMRKVGAKNAYGVESEFIYKVRLGYTGGIEVDINNWKLINLLSEEVR